MPRRRRDDSLPNRNAGPAPGAPRSTPDPTRSGALLLIVLAGVLVAQALLVAPLRRLPSELYGGDLYYQRGCVESILATGNPMATCSTCETRPGYLPAYGTLVALVARAGSLEAERAMLVMAVVFKLAAVLAFHRLFSRLAGPGPAVAAAALWYATHPGLILRYTTFAAEVVVPLFLLALWRLVEKPGALRAGILGLALGVAGYAHAVVYIGGVAITLLAGALRTATAWRDPAVRRALPWALAAAALGVVLSLGYWYEPIFVHHGRTSLHYTEWNGGPTLSTLAARLSLARRFLAGQLDFASLAAGLASVLALAGVAWGVRRRREPRLASALIVAGACLAWVFHYFASELLLGVNFIPEYAGSMLWGGARELWVALALGGVVAWARSAGARSAATVALTAFAALLGIGATAERAAAPEIVAARTPLAPVYRELRGWVQANTRPGDVFLSSQALSFMLSALTGREVLVTRRAQNDAFADMDARVEDAALILYGRDSLLRSRGLERWKVRYLLWTERWLETEFDRSADGRIVDYFDPLLYFEDGATDSLLVAAGVRIRHVTGWVDPALRTPDVRQFPLSIVTHENYRSFMRPWNAGLDPLLRKVWAYAEAGREIAAIYVVTAP